MEHSILVVNDLPGVGKVAGSINVPVLSAGQLDVSILPTLLLSTFASGKGQVVRHYLEDDFQAMLDHWDELEIAFSTILTGYFANSQQIIAVKNYYEQQIHQPKLMVDPTMGDLGRYYKGFDQSIADTMLELIQHAEVIMPNITEACLLTKTAYRPDLSLAELEVIGQKLLQTGAKNVIISGVSPNPANSDSLDTIGFYLISPDSEAKLILHKRYDHLLYGTGDLAISLTTALYVTGFSLIKALEITGKLMESVIETTLSAKRSKDSGLRFEPMLGELIQIIQSIRKEEL